MIENLYLDFKKKVEKKFKMEVDTLTISDINGEVKIEFAPVTKKFTFESKNAEDQENETEVSENETENVPETEENSSEEEE